MVHHRNMDEHSLPARESYNPPYSTNNDIRTFLSWSAPGRPFSKKGRQFYATVILLMLLFEVILFLFSWYELMVVVLALVFLSLVLYTIPPKDFHYKITSEGIRVEDHFYIWTELYDFYFKRVDHTDTLIIRTEVLLPGELKLTLGSVHRDHVRQILVNYLPYREYVKPTFVERSADWLAKNFPLEGK
jgi:hypothetical protein